jgi:hypothetical protein
MEYCPLWASWMVNERTVRLLTDGPRLGLDLDGRGANGNARFYTSEVIDPLSLPGDRYRHEQVTRNPEQGGTYEGRLRRLSFRRRDDAEQLADVREALDTDGELFAVGLDDLVVAADGRIERDCTFVGA